MAVLPQQLGGLAEAKMRALLGMDSGAAQLMSVAAAGNYGYQYQQYNNNNCAGGVVSGGAQSELTCNGGAGGGAVAYPSRKRGRDGMAEQYVSSTSALLPVPGMQVKQQADPSTSGRQALETQCAAAALASELCRQQGAELDALVRAECDRVRAGLEQARKRQRQALVTAVVGAAERRLREKDAELCAARRRAVELEERLRQAAAESQAWCGVARANEAVAAGLRATVDHLILRGGRGGVAGDAAEGCGESDDPEDAQSCCVVAKDINNVATATSSPAEKWACKACGAGDATVLLLPCRHLCLCKACEPKMDACPVCLAVKKTSIHVADNN